MDEQQKQQEPGDPNAENAATDPNKTLSAEEQAARRDYAAFEKQKADQEAAKQQAAAGKYDPNAAGGDPNAGKYDPNQSAPERTGLLGRFGRAIEHDTGMDAIERHERRRQAFTAADAKPVQDAVNDVNAFLNAMREKTFDTPQEMLADSDIQNAAKRARDGLKVFTGDTPVVFSKPTSDAHLNVGSGGAVTGNTPANRERAAAVREQHAPEDEEAVPAGVATVPQPDAHVR